MNEHEFFADLLDGESDTVAAALLVLKLGEGWSARHLWERMGCVWTDEMEAVATSIEFDNRFFPGR